MQRLVGAAEVGEALGGLSRQRVNQLTTRPDFPAPLIELRMGKVWKLADIEAWAERKGRTLTPLVPGSSDVQKGAPRADGEA